MSRFLFKILSVFLFLCVLSPPAYARHNYKVEIGMPFVHFDIEDVYRQRWVSTYLRGKPIVILTGNRHQRYEILKWAESFRYHYGMPGPAHFLWVVNLRRTPWDVGRGTLRRQWQEVNSPIPVLLDWDGTIGRALRINYDIPNIILIDSFGRLAMHEMHTFNPHVFQAVCARIAGLLALTPGASVPAAMSVPAPVVRSPGQITLPPLGRKGDSN